MIMVTGGAGFIGSALVKLLNDQNKKNIIIVDRLHSGKKWMNLRGLKYYRLVKVEDLFLDENKYLFDDLQEIYHLGACSSTLEMNADYLWKNNIEFSQKLFKIAVKKNAKFLFASSAATYGDGELGYNDDHASIGKLRPLNPYGYSKQVFDEWLLSHPGKPTNWFGVKFFNVYGPNEYHKGDMRSVVIKAYEQIRDTKKVKLFKSYNSKYQDGEQLRDFIYVLDAAQCLIKLMQSKNNGIYNLGTGKARSFKDLVNATFTALNLTPTIEYIEMPESIKGQYQYFTEANMSKFNSVIKHEFMSLEMGVASYVNDYLTKANPYLETTSL
ncbi:MAG: ADP-glyceromanno-heptose 6-epimerase [Bacteriovoracaceae bacterium]